MSRKDDDLDLTVQTLIDLDEPEALVATLAREAKRRSSAPLGAATLKARWLAAAQALETAELLLLGPPGRPAEPPAEPPAAA